MANLNEGITDAWQVHCLTFANMEKSDFLVQKAFEIGFVEGCNYTVRRLTNGVGDKKPKPTNEGS
jgi:hypothetical protein